MFNRQRSRAIDDFAISLAREFANRCPPDNRPDNPGHRAKVASVVDETCNRAAAFRREQDLGMYGRAKLGTAFKLELKQIGYQDEFVDELTGLLLVTMSGK